MGSGKGTALGSGKGKVLGSGYFQFMDRGKKWNMTFIEFVRNSDINVRRASLR